MPYFKNETGVYYTDLLEPTLGGRPATDKEVEAFVAKLNVPPSVTRLQARTALFQAGHWDTIEAIMSNPDTPMVTKLAWQDAQTFERDSPVVNSLATQLGLSDAQVDELFIAANQI